MSDDRPPANALARPFWREKSLDQLTRDEWESLCDGCGRCCTVKLEDEDTGEVHYTDAICRLYDTAGCGCSDYSNRKRHVPDCVVLSAEVVPRLHWLPRTCAYRLVAEGTDLPWWHHLVCGDREEVHRAGMSVRGRVIPEDWIDEEDLPTRIANWLR